LAQSSAFQLDPDWLYEAFDQSLAKEDLQKRAELLLKVGLWTKRGDKIQTVAPVIKTGDQSTAALKQTHKSLLKKAVDAMDTMDRSERFFEGRTFLVNKKDLPIIQSRVKAFKQSLETEFSDENSTDVYQLHSSFFPL
jgi:hypothetical protein